MLSRWALKTSLHPAGSCSVPIELVESQIPLTFLAKSPFKIANFEDFFGLFFKGKYNDLVSLGMVP